MTEHTDPVADISLVEIGTLEPPYEPRLRLRDHVCVFFAPTRSITIEHRICVVQQAP
jgi:hypothetical protein